MEFFDTAQGRRSSILAKLREDANVSVSDLSNEFGVSEVTIRKDLRILEGRNLLVRVHGGAMRSSNPSGPAFEESHYDTKALVNCWRNRLIGEKILPENERFTFQTATYLNKDSELQSSGLLGPVEIHTFGK